MFLPPKTLAWRLLIWTGLFVWAVWKLRSNDVPETSSGPLVVGPLAEEPASPPDIVDLHVLAAALDAVAAAGCDAEGTLTVEVGRAGLTRADYTGSGDRACLEAAVRGAAWPRTAMVFTTDRAIGR